jgi:hypothetical protein
MIAKVDPLTAARAEALFTSHLSTSSRPTATDVADAIRTAVRAHGGTRGCAADVAAAYGDHPEIAAPRMRWARGVVDEIYGVRQAAVTPDQRSWALVA